MTQKELLYLEDAICHEESIIKICNDSISKISDENLTSFLENEINSHQNLKEELMDLLREKANG